MLSVRMYSILLILGHLTSHCYSTASTIDCVSSLFLQTLIEIKPYIVLRNGNRGSLFYG